MAGLPLSPTLEKPADTLEKPVDLIDILIERGTPELEELRDLRRLGWQDDRLTPAQSQRPALNTWDTKYLRTIFTQTHRVMSEINECVECIPKSGHLRFLDVGCNPGGCAWFILCRNNDATGVGTSLPADKGGQPSTLERWTQRRFTQHDIDLLTYDLGQDFTEKPGFTSLNSNIGRHSFDITILETHLVSTYVSPTSDSSGDPYRLFIAQIVVALHAVKPGGTLVFKLFQLEQMQNAKLLWMLDQVSEGLVTYKSHTIQSSRSVFFAVATGVGRGVRGAQMDAYEQGLRALWTELTFGESDVRKKYTTNLDFIISSEDLVASYLGRLTDLGRSVWTEQAGGLRWLFQKKGIL